MHNASSVATATVACLVCGSLVIAETPATAPDLVIGTVFGKVITAADVELTESISVDVRFDGRDKEPRNLASRISNKFGRPINNRFIEEHRIGVTRDEIVRFKQSTVRSQKLSLIQDEMRLAKLTDDLATADLADTKRAKLQDQVRILQRILERRLRTDDRDTPDEIAQTFIKRWKVERELQRTYGGRVIFQQFGLEALDARRKLYEEAEKNGDLKFDDPGVRHMFYYYYVYTHHTPVDEDALDRPWFFAAD